MATLALTSLLLLASTISPSSPVPPSSLGSYAQSARNRWLKGSLYLTKKVPYYYYIPGEICAVTTNLEKLSSFPIPNVCYVHSEEELEGHVSQLELRWNVSLTVPCVWTFCDECILGRNNDEGNCHSHCGSEDIVLSRREVDVAFNNNTSRCLDDCEFLDLPGSFTNLSSCDALDLLANITNSTRGFCPRAVVERIVDGCVGDFAETDQLECSDFILFDSYSEGGSQDAKEFCAESREHALLCGAFCRFNGPSIPDECNAETRDVCRIFVELKKYLESEEEVELYSSSLLNFAEKVNIDTIGAGIREVVKSTRRMRRQLTEKASNNILKILDIAFNESYAEQWTTPTIATTTEVFEDMNDTLLLIMESVTSDQDDNGTFVFRGSNIAIDVMKFRRGLSGSQFSFPTEDQVQNSSLLEQVNVTIPFTSPCDEAEDDDGCFVTIGIAVINNFADYITEAINDRDDEPVSGRRETDSSLLSVRVINSNNSFTEFGEDPVTIRFMPQGGVTISQFTYGVHFLDPQFSWSVEGISDVSESNDVLDVTSNHLTSFAILASPTGAAADSVPLTIVTYIGCVISIVCLILTIFILLLFRKKLKKGVLLYIHLNLSLALLLAMIVFIAGVDHASFNMGFCLFVAALIQYLFLCAFFWMLGEGVMLYLLIVKVFGNTTKRWYLLIPICWGVPAVIVAVSAGALHSDYITQNSTVCWIDASPSRPAIWTFLVPLIVVICVNAVILAMTVYSIVKTRKVGSTEGSHSNTELVRTAVKGSLVLLPLLGLTWVFGLFAVSQNTFIFAWIFTIVNSLQGLFIFLVHVARNEYLLCILKKKLVSSSWTERYRRISLFSVKSFESNGRSSEAHFTVPTLDTETWENKDARSATESDVTTISQKE